jgi:hypothetical protein
MRSVGAVSALLATIVAVGSGVAAAGTPGPNPIEANPIEVENALPGTAGWLIREPQRQGIAGYVDDVSYAPGATVRLFVASHGAPFSYAVFRMGYYGNTGGRLVGGPTAVPSSAGQPTPTVQDDRTDGAKLLLTHWHESARFTIPDDWVSGFYLIRLTNTLTGAETYAWFVLRAAAPAPVVVVIPTNTWHAYNHWGGLSLYRDKRGELPGGIVHTRAHKVSFLRPHVKGYGAGFFFRSERPLVHWLERSGYPVSYATDTDAHLDRLVGPRTRLVILSGHPEYQTLQERNVYLRMGRRGVSLAIFGGNSFVTQMRLSSNSQVATVWRHRALDPVKGRFATIRWELAGWNHNALTGTMDGAGGIGPLAAAATKHWAWKGANVANGRQLGPVSGNEQDGIVLNRSTPPRLEVLARAKGRNKSGRERVADVTIIPGPHRTFVFNGSQNWFTYYLAYPPYPGVVPATWVAKPYPHASQVNAPIQRLAGNLIQRATGVPNREPARPPRFRTLPYLSVRTPGPYHLVPIGRPIVVVWSGVPPGTVRVRIALDGRVVAEVSAARSTWTIPGVGSLGRHMLRMTALDRRGNVVQRTRRTFPAALSSHPAFTVPSPYGLLWRAWG